MAGDRTRPPGHRFFSEDSLWRRPVPGDAAVHPDSAEMIAAKFHTDPGIMVNCKCWSMPVYFTFDSGTGQRFLAESSTASRTRWVW